jgi:hypothetical protein
VLLAAGCDDGGSGGGEGDAAPVVDASPDAAPPAPDAADDAAPADPDAARDAQPPDAQPPDAQAPDAAVDFGVPPDAAPLFAEGCPRPGRAVARRIADPRVRMEGPSALGGEGDWLLMNDRAAFIVQAPERPKTWYYYGGIVVDAVALDGCRQPGPEKFDELGLAIGRADVRDFPASILRAFAGESVEVVSDGRDGGEARLRVHGRDELFWLVELELVKRVFLAGGHKPLSGPLGFETYVDYVLEPDRPVLRIELHLRNDSGEATTYQTGMAVFFGDGTTRRIYNRNALSLGGFDVRFGVPWLVADGGDGAWALAFGGANAGALHLSGVDAVIDMNQFLAAPRLGPGAEAVSTFHFAVGPTDADSAVRHLRDVNPVPVPGMAYENVPVGGLVTDAETGEPLAGALLELQTPGANEAWMTVDAYRSGPDGRWGGMLPAFRGAAFRLVPSLEGRPSPEPIEITAESGVPPVLNVAFGAAGRVAWDVRDGDGRALPVKIELWRDGRRFRRIFATDGPGARDVPPGTYEVAVTRGFEYEAWRGPLEVRAGEEARLDITLRHVVDTEGWLSFDGHLHGGPSADSPVPVPDRIRTVVAEGLDVALSTDHEFVADWAPGVAESGLGEWVDTVIGQEVTATLPEHANAWPLVPDPDDPRGDFPRWYGLDLDGFFGLMRERGAGIIQLNHPRQGCNYLCLVRYDRLTGRPGIEDGSGLGVEGDPVLWSWNFDAVEYMNGYRSPFVDPDSPEDTGMFEDWTSFLNHGHRITATGVTDEHDWGPPGSPRTYFVGGEPFDEDEMVASVKAGKAQVSAGAFAHVRANDMGGPGDTVSAADGEISLSIRVEAMPQIDVTHVIVFVNCDEALKIAATDPSGVVKLDDTFTVPVPRDAHVIVMAFGRGDMPLGMDGYDPRRIPRVTTNALYVDADADGEWTPPGGKTCAYSLDPP